MKYLGYDVLVKINAELVSGLLHSSEHNEAGNERGGPE